MGLVGQESPSAGLGTRPRSSSAIGSALSPLLTYILLPYIASSRVQGPGAVSQRAASPSLSLLKQPEENAAAKNKHKNQHYFQHGAVSTLFN